MIIYLGLSTSQCEKQNGLFNRDPESDAPEWSGGNTDANEHINRNDESGTTRGGDYGDLFALLRDDIGRPVMTPIEIEDEVNYFVQPVDAAGNTLELDSEGELVHPEAAIEVDFGRLNIVRSPVSVLEQAFNEVMKVMAEGDNFILDYCNRLTIWNGGVIIKTIDSPRENMALYKEIMNEGFSNRLAILNDYDIDPLLMAAGCFAAGSDKTGTVDIDEVVYINGFMDCLGLYPIENEFEFDWSTNQDDVDPPYAYKRYFNYGNLDGENTPFAYNRTEVYEGKMIQFLLWDNVYYPIDEEGNSNGPIFSVLDIMEGLADGQNRFTYQWNNQNELKVKGFAIAVDDAVQVLEFVHGDSNVRFLP